MKKNPAHHSYTLPNANVDGHLQIYKGDFFIIFVAPLSSGEVPQLQNFTRLRFKLNAFTFELQISDETFEDFPTLQNPETLHHLTQHYSLATEANLLAFFDSRLRGGLADRFLYAKVVSLLVILAQEAEALSGLPRIREYYNTLAEQTRDRIVADLSIYETVDQLARRAGTSKQILQTAFRQRFGTTVGRFSREVRLDHARHLLATTNETLLSIALTVGYSDPANFSTAYKTKFGHPPRKKMK